MEHFQIIERLDPHFIQRLSMIQIVFYQRLFAENQKLLVIINILRHYKVSPVPHFSLKTRQNLDLRRIIFKSKPIKNSSIIVKSDFVIWVFDPHRMLEFVHIVLKFMVEILEIPIEVIELSNDVRKIQILVKIVMACQHWL